MDRSLQSADSGSYGCCSSVVLRTDSINNDTDRPSDNLSATHRWRATSPMWSPTPNPVSRPEGRKIKYDNECLLSKINFHCDPTRGVTTLAFLARSRNTTATRSQLSIRAGRDCVRERL